MKSNLVSKSETASILAEVERQWGFSPPRIKNMMVHEVHDGKLMTGGGIVVLCREGRYLPFLSQTDLLGRFPRVTVDMGAVRFMCNGANLMRPGIRGSGEFGRNAVVTVAEESRGKFLAVGISQVQSSQLGMMERGEVVLNLHHVSDRFWEAAKSIKGI